MKIRLVKDRLRKKMLLKMIILQIWVKLKKKVIQRMNKVKIQIILDNFIEKEFNIGEIFKIKNIFLNAK